MKPSRWNTGHPKTDLECAGNVLSGRLKADIGTSTPEIVEIMLIMMDRIKQLEAGEKAESAD